MGGMADLIGAAGFGPPPCPSFPETLDEYIQCKSEPVWWSVYQREAHALWRWTCRAMMLRYKNSVVPEYAAHFLNHLGGMAGVW